MIDMHIHSTYSDGTYSLKEILKKAEELKLSHISITDHEKCLAYKELEEIDVKKYYSGKIIPGIEIKCGYKGRLLDLLGYNFDVVKMQNWLDEFYKDKKRDIMQNKYFNYLYEACQKLNLKMTPKDEIKWNPKNDWASFVIYSDFKKYSENKEKLPEDLWEDFSIFTKKYCADFKSVFYIDKTKDCPSLDIAIKAIKDCGGIAIIAHVYIYKWAQNKEKFIQEIIDEYDIDGFECYYTEYTDEQTKYIVDICKKSNFYMSGGSDSHGENKPWIKIGRGKGNLNISESIIKSWVDKGGCYGEKY